MEPQRLGEEIIRESFSAGLRGQIAGSEQRRRLAAVAESQGLSRNFLADYGVPGRMQQLAFEDFLAEAAVGVPPPHNEPYYDFSRGCLCITNQQFAITELPAVPLLYEFPDDSPCWFTSQLMGRVNPDWKVPPEVRSLMGEFEELHTAAEKSNLKILTAPREVPGEYCRLSDPELLLAALTGLYSSTIAPAAPLGGHRWKLEGGRSLWMLVTGAGSERSAFERAALEDDLALQLLKKYFEPACSEFGAKVSSPYRAFRSAAKLLGLKVDVWDEKAVSASSRHFSQSQEVVTIHAAPDGNMFGYKIVWKNA